ncbi:MAG: hypothetical protein WC295_04480 [Methanoregula sp.]
MKRFVSERWFSRLMFFFVLSGLIGSVHAAPLDTPSPTPLQKHRSPHYLRLSQSDTSCWRLNKGSAKMDKFHWSTTLCAVLLFSCCVQIAYATPPPPEGRANYLLPNPSEPYYNQSIDLGFLVDSSYDDGKLSPFPRLSEYRNFRNFSFTKTGRAYISEVWYFNDWTTFKTNNDELGQYLKKHGTIVPVSLDITEELALTHDPYIAGLHAKHINATKYVANETSGYFILLSTDFFPGENYFIAYYGVIGQSDLVNDTPQIKTLIMSCFPGFIENQKYIVDPTSPTNQPVPLPAGIVIGSLLLAVLLIAGRQRRRG